MPTQDSLKLSVSLDKFGSLHDVLVHCVRTNGPRKDEVLAQQLGATKGHFSEVLNAKGKHWPEAWIELIAKNYDPDGLVARYVARWAGLTVRPARLITDAAHRRATIAVLGRHNGVGQALLKEIEEEALAEVETDEGGAR